MKDTAIYAGTFDPVTLGHLDIIERASKLFTKVIVGVARENYKNTLFSDEERVALIVESTSHLDNVEVVCFSGLLIDFAAQNDNAVIVRGMRALSDFDSEFQVSLMNKKLNPDLETIFLMTADKYLYVSSSLVKKYALLDANIADIVPENVVKALKEKYQN